MRWFFMFVLTTTFVIGYCVNIVKFIRCDFREPYRAEVLRGIGISFPPVGGVLGYVTIKDN